MPLRPFLDKGASFGPDDLAVMTAAFSMALQKLGLNDRKKDAMLEIVGRHIIRAAMCGERDPSKLCRDALDALSPGKEAS
jgi:hypothetical protein